MRIDETETDLPIVVIVDDDSAILHSLTFALETEGLGTRVYASAGAILADPSLPTRGCMVVDYRLDAMNGLQLIARLRADGVMLPAILMTVEATPGVIRQAEALGVPVVEKPFLENQLLSDIRQAIASQPPRMPSSLR